MKLRISLESQIIHIQIIVMIVHFIPLPTLPNSLKHCLTSFFPYTSIQEMTLIWGGGRAGVMDTTSSKGSITYGYKDIL